MKKNETYDVKIIDNGTELEGITKIDGMTVFVPYAIKDETVRIKILKVNSNYAFAKLEKVLVPSINRQLSKCDASMKCGGCEGLHIDYDSTIDIKLNNVKNTLKKQGIDSQKVISICGMANPFGYRNKAQFPVRDVDGMIKFGMFARRSHTLIDSKDCLIQNPVINVVAKHSFDLLNKYGFTGYNEKSLSGDIRNIMIRIGINTKEIMVVFVTNCNLAQDKRMSKLAVELSKYNSNIVSIMLNTNIENSNVILGEENVCVFGREYLIDEIDGKKFMISVNSFFQVNTHQAEVLYNILKKDMNLEQSKTLLDLYSGVGSIGIFLSDSVKKVYGVEIEKEAVNMAEQNLKLNGVENATYIAGDASEELERLNKDGVKFNYVVVDPPRKGLELNGIETLLKLLPEKIGYVSCNPATLARDIKLLESKYVLEKIELVDMFPYTTHVECVCVLKLR